MMGKNARNLELQRIFEVIKKEFKFLVDKWDCRMVQGNVDDFGSFVSYKNRTTGIKVSYEPMEGGVFVQLSKLVSGEFPSYNIQITPETKVLTFDLLDLLSIHGGPLYSTLKQGVDRSIKDAAKGLGIFGVDVLIGNFTDLPQIETRVKKRASKNKVCS